MLNDRVQPAVQDRLLVGPSFGPVAHRHAEHAASYLVAFGRPVPLQRFQVVLLIKEAPADVTAPHREQSLLAPPKRVLGVHPGVATVAGWVLAVRSIDR